MKLVAVTGGVESQPGECVVKVLTLQDWATVYELQLATPSSLARCSTFQVRHVAPHSRYGTLLHIPGTTRCSTF